MLIYLLLLLSFSLEAGYHRFKGCTNNNVKIFAADTRSRHRSKRYHSDKKRKKDFPEDMASVVNNILEDHPCAKRKDVVMFATNSGIKRRRRNSWYY